MNWLKYLVLLAFFCGPPLDAQTGFLAADAQTYRYYTAQNWDSLLIVGHEALREGIDYYYLRYRMGEAAFRKRQYWKSIRHFEQALHFNSGDPLVKEFVFFSYWNEGRYADAWLQSMRFGEPFLKQQGFKKRQWLEYANMEAGFKASAQDNIQTLGYLSLGLNHRPGLRWHYYHAVSALRQQFFEDQVIQTEYAGLARFQAAKGVGIFASGRYLYAQSERDARFEEGGFQRRLKQILAQEGWTALAGVELSTGRWTFSPFLGRVKAPGSISGNLITYTGHGNQSTATPIDSAFNIETWQAGAEIFMRIRPTWRFGLLPNAQYDGDSWRLFFGAELQISPPGNWYFSLNYLNDPQYNYLEVRGMIFDNSPSALQNRWRAIAHYRFSPKIALYGIAQWEQRRLDTLPFDYITFIAGIKRIL